jgi:hypothetical protein
VEFIKKYYYCSEILLQNCIELVEIEQCIEQVDWKPEFSFNDEKEFIHQKGYNMAFTEKLTKLKWVSQPILHNRPILKGDFMKNGIFVEVQFGNTATIFRDYYKFHFGFINNLLGLAIYILPTSPKDFFPTRKNDSISNMAEFDKADKYFNLLRIPIPIVMYGLKSSNFDLF